MANDQESQSITMSLSSSNSDQSIINRKRQCRGIPSSFSANLSLRKSPSRGHGDSDATPPKKKSSGGNTSVKAIVAWLESAKDESRSVTSVSSDARSKSSFTTASLSSKPAPVIQQQNLPMAPDVEEYSLTLLKYRQYFTERPLARCLDEKIIEVTTCSVTHVPGDSRHSTPIAGQEQNTTVFLNTNERNQNIGGVSAAGTKTDAHKSQAATRDCDEGCSARSHNSVQQYWENVRSALWISNEELEEVEVTKPIKVKPKMSLRKGAGTISPSSHEGTRAREVKQDCSPRRKIRSVPNFPVGFVRGRKKRFLSVEEKMLEIDVFLGTC